MRNEENLIIPDILLESVGLRASEVYEIEPLMQAQAGLLVESGREVHAERFVEAGITDFLRNLFTSGRFKPTTQNVSNMLRELELVLSRPNSLSSEEAEYAGSVVRYLKNINQNTGKGIHKPFRNEMKTDWTSISEAVERAKNGDLSGLKSNIGNAADNSADALKAFRSFSWSEKLLNHRDRRYFQAIVPGVQRANGSSLTFEEFFKNSAAVRGGNPATALADDIQIIDKSALDSALDTLAKDVGTSATLKGLAQRAKLLWIAAPAVATVGAVGYGINAVGKNPAIPSDFDKAFNDGAMGDVMNSKTTPSSGTNPGSASGKPGNSGSGTSGNSGGLGGTTNGNNFGNLGGKLPELPANKLDWLPTNTNASDYYKVVHNSNQVDGQRVADNTAAATSNAAATDPFSAFENMPKVDFEDVLGRVFTILEQGGPSEQTLSFVKEYVEQEYAKVAPYVKKYESLQNPSMRNVSAQVDTMIEVAKGVKSVADQAEQAANIDHRGEPKAKSDSDDFLNNLDIAQREAYAQLAGFGVDMKTADAMLSRLRQECNMASILEAVKFIQEIAAVASTAHTDVQSVFETAVNILKRQISSPERAIAILRVIGKYESKAPGLGLFQLANQAATGSYNPQELFLIRYSLPTEQGQLGMDASRDLQQAFDGINMPNTALGAELAEYNRVHQTYQQANEMLMMRMQRVKLEIQKRREELLTDVFKGWYESIPGWAKNNPIFKGVLQLLNGVAYSSAIWQTMKHGFGVGGNGLTSPQGAQNSNYGFVGASNVRVRKVLGQAGVAPVDLAPNGNVIPNGQPAPNGQVSPAVSNEPTPQQQQAAQNIQNLNQGNPSEVNDLAVQLGIQNTEIGKRLSALEGLVPRLRNTLLMNYNNIMSMLSVGNKGGSMFDNDINSAAYATPEQIEEYANGAITNASDVVHSILELLKIYQYIVQTYSTDGNKSKAIENAGLRQREADYRAQLAEAQTMRVRILDIAIVGSIDQKVRLLEPQYQELEANMEMMVAFNNVGADAFVLPFAQVAMQMSALYLEAADRYNKAVGQMQNEPQMVQFCQQRAKQMGVAGARARAKGITALRNLMKQQGGSAVASTNDKFVRIAEETLEKDAELAVEDGEGVLTDVEAKPLPVDEYWDKLYKNDPPYGDVMVHPEKHRDEPSWKMRPKHRVKRLN